MNFPKENQGYEIISFVLTDQYEADGEILTTGVVIGRTNNPDIDKYVTWRCGKNSTDNEWVFWSGYSTGDIHKALDDFAYRANLRPDAAEAAK